MDYRNQRGQVLVESIFLVFIIMSVLIAFQIMIDHQKAQSNKYKMSKTTKDNIYDQKSKNESQ